MVDRPDLNLLMMNEFDAGGYSNWLFGIIGLFLSFVLLSLKFTFGTFSVFSAITTIRKRKMLEDKYRNLFSTRENLLYHISWAKSRGDFEDAKRMLIQLEALDKVGASVFHL